MVKLEGVQGSVQPTSIGPVKASFKFYLDIWLFTITMVGDIDLPALELALEQSKSSFALVSLLEQGPQ